MRHGGSLIGLMGDFLDYLTKARGRQRSTVKTYWTAWELVFDFALERHGLHVTDIDVEDITHQFVRDFLEWLGTERRKKNCPNSRNLRLAAVKSFFSFLAEEHPLKYGVQAQMILALRGSKIEENETNYLSLTEVNLLIGTTDTCTHMGIRNRAILTLMPQTGIRNEELRMIRMRDLHLAGPSPFLHIAFGKGRKQRSIPLHEPTVLELEAWLRVRADADGGEDGPLFITTHGGALSEPALALVVDSAVSKVRLEHPDFTTKPVTPHVLRHTAAMLMVESGVDIADISMILGHKDVKTTMRYIHHNLKIKERAMARVTFPYVENMPMSPPALERWKPSEHDKILLDALRKKVKT